MSRIGKKPVALPSGVECKIAGDDITVKGPKGALSIKKPPLVNVVINDSDKQVEVSRVNGSKQAQANHGLARSLVQNMVTGVTDGFQKRLLIFGTGYNTKLQGRTLHLNIGYMGRNRQKGGSQFELPVPDGVEVEVEAAAARGDTEPAKLLIKGADKQRVGQFAAEIRALRTTEPYKGKGIRYEDEHVVRKQGKALTGG